MGHFYSHSTLKIIDDCERCFYHTIVNGANRPSFPVASITYGIDDNLKALFERHRANGTRPPHLETSGLDLWIEPNSLAQARDGIRWEGKHGNVLYGRLDEIVMRNGKAEAADFKTRNRKPNAKQVKEYVERYTTQLNVYNYLLRKIGLEVGDLGHLIVAWPTTMTDTHIEYETQVIPISTSDAHMNTVLRRALAIVEGPEPRSTRDCKWCYDRRSAVRRYRLDQADNKNEESKKQDAGDATKTAGEKTNDAETSDARAKDETTKAHDEKAKTDKSPDETPIP